MKASIIKIGNSRGVRIPKAILEETGLDAEVTLRVEDKKIIISAARKPKGTPSQLNEEYHLSVGALSKDWDRPEEDAAWNFLQ